MLTCCAHYLNHVRRMPRTLYASTSQQQGANPESSAWVGLAETRIIRRTCRESSAPPHRSLISLYLTAALSRAATEEQRDGRRKNRLTRHAAPERGRRGFVPSAEHSSCPGEYRARLWGPRCTKTIAESVPSPCAGGQPTSPSPRCVRSRPPAAWPGTTSSTMTRALLLLCYHDQALVTGDRFLLALDPSTSGRQPVRRLQTAPA